MLSWQSAAALEMPAGPATPCGRPPLRAPSRRRAMSEAAATASRAPARLLTATLALPAPATARTMTWHSMMVCGWCTRSPANLVCSPARAATKIST